MACPHPLEERLRIYDGTAVARTDRRLCGLCGETVYELLAADGEAKRVRVADTGHSPSGPHV